MRVCVARLFVRRMLNWLAAALLLSGVALLSYCAWVWMDARRFERVQSARLADHRARRGQRPASTVGAAHPTPTALGAPVVPDTPISQPRQTTPAPAAGAEERATGLIGRIQIRRLSVSAIIVEGVDSLALRRAVGHLPGTALPGQVGSIALAGHRDTYFRRLAGVRLGDQIELATFDGDYRYEVVSMTIVSPANVEVLKDTEKEQLVLITCYPFDYLGPAPDRFVVAAKRVGAP